MEAKKMICFSCCLAGDSDQKRLPKNVEKKYEDSREFAAFANLSLKTDRGQRKFIAKEIDKLNKRNISSRIFKYRELCDVTNNFNDEGLIGEGGFGRVYKAKVDDKEVAIKKLDPNGFQGNKEFLVEVLVLSRIEHPNLVNLVGYCTDADQKVLVYEYLKNGSLEDHLLDLAPDKMALDWNTRMRIAAGAARGLEHLHETANPPIIYRDFKASNILLDGDFNSKLSDFGLAKFGPTGKQSHISTAVMGTYGYCAPEYAATGKLTTKSDIYSFGVVFLELISGRRVIDDSRPENEQNLVEWAQPLFKDKSKFELMADPKLKGNYSTKSLYQALAIAAMCLQEEADTRPYISDVVVALEFICDDKAKENNAAAGKVKKSRTNVEALQHTESNVGMEMN